MATIDIVFYGPPGPQSVRFLETEDENGHGIVVGEWIDRGNGFWALRIPRVDLDDRQVSLEPIITIPLPDPELQALPDEEDDTLPGQPEPRFRDTYLGSTDLRGANLHGAVMTDANSQMILRNDGRGYCVMVDWNPDGTYTYRAGCREGFSLHDARNHWREKMCEDFSPDTRRAAQLILNAIEAFAANVSAFTGQLTDISKKLEDKVKRLAEAADHLESQAAEVVRLRAALKVAEDDADRLYRRLKAEVTTSSHEVDWRSASALNIHAALVWRGE